MHEINSNLQHPKHKKSYQLAALTLLLSNLGGSGVLPRRFRTESWQPAATSRSRKFREISCRFRDFNLTVTGLDLRVFILPFTLTVISSSPAVQTYFWALLSPEHWLSPTFFQIQPLHSRSGWFLVRLSKETPPLVFLCTWWSPNWLGGSFTLGALLLDS